MNDQTISILNALSDAINKRYGYVTINGENFGEPAINSGPCGPFANTFYTIWNQKFTKKVHLVFIMVKNSDECWHVLVRLPDGSLFDGGFGVHHEDRWDTDKFFIQDMPVYELNLLEKHSGGLNRVYPRYCPDFSLDFVTKLIIDHLDLIAENKIK